MIGFELTATSNVGFSRTRGAWTEGSFWLAKKALSKTAPKGTGIFTPDLIGGIEEQFDKLKDVLVNDVGGVENFFYLNLTGSVLGTIKFDPATPANIKIWRLLHQISLNNTELGDQVMIYLCKCITDFDDHVTVKTAFGGLATTPILNVEIEL
jgi:hypothetical protein